MIEKEGGPLIGCYRAAMPLQRAPGPRVLGTWSFSQPALEAAWPHLEGGAGEGAVLDALLAACAHADCDPNVDSVGFGGLPDAGGRMSLDGAVMLGPARFGGVCGLRRHLHPAAVARLVMERTEHRLLCGEDADDFADRHGLSGSELLSAEAREAWASWQRRRDAVDDAAIDQSKDAALLGLRPIDPGPGSAAGGRLFRPDSEGVERAAPFGHDTICVLARDRDGLLGAASSTSGLPFKVPGRVGDSPIAGHGLFVEPGIGAATATGTGELISGICASMVAVEALRRGRSPLEAIAEVMRRVEAIGDLRPHHQVAMIVMDADGAVATGGFRPGFLSVVRDDEGARILLPDLVHRPDDDALPESATDGFAKSVPPPS
jgi:isoaspartyl peptidase/L-asparaginase-like protein (Ntn-hydrolase superfamily)